MAGKRYYVRNSVVPFEEDMFHEFKGHRNLAIEELPPWCYIPGTTRRSRRAASRAINGFLNTGKGGTVFLGIIDEGICKGIRLSQYQKDHVLVSLEDLMNRYKPKVDSERYKVEFVPILAEEDINNPFRRDTKDDSPPADYSRLKPHLLRTPDFCWCDQDAMAKYSLGIEQQEYVIEIVILPYEAKMVEIWNNQYRLNLHPIHEDEEGNCYFRRQASLVQYRHSEISEQTREEVKQYYEPVIAKYYVFSEIKKRTRGFKNASEQVALCSALKETGFKCARITEAKVRHIQQKRREKSYLRRRKKTVYTYSRDYKFDKEPKKVGVQKK